jgi:hypothetical protein
MLSGIKGAEGAAESGIKDIGGPSGANGNSTVQKLLDKYK